MGSILGWTLVKGKKRQLVTEEYWTGDFKHAFFFRHKTDCLKCLDGETPVRARLTWASEKVSDHE